MKTQMNPLPSLATLAFGRFTGSLIEKVQALTKIKLNRVRSPGTARSGRIMKQMGYSSVIQLEAVAPSSIGSVSLECVSLEANFEEDE